MTLPSLRRGSRNNGSGGGGGHKGDSDGGIGASDEEPAQEENPIPANRMETLKEKARESPELKQKLQQISLKYAKARSPNIKSTYDPKDYQTDDMAFRGELPKRKRKGYDHR